ncbi:MAG TPA: type VI secretion system tip protein VgrG [Pirellulales bacterium]
MAITQENRLLAFHSPLGKDVLLLDSFSGREAMSTPYHFDVHLRSANDSISFGSLVGKPAAIELKTAAGQRYFHGIISEFVQDSKNEGLALYHASLVPWLANLSHTADCRIFQNKKVPDIVKQIFQDLGFNDYKLKLSGSYQPRVYCVQYRETDLDFVSRLLEEEGIFYFFEHTADKHTLVIGDTPSVHQPCPGQSSGSYVPAGGDRGKDAIHSWTQQQSIRPSKYVMTDYNFETPSTDLKVNAPTVSTVGKNEKLEVYDYEGRFQKRDVGERLVKLRIQEYEASHTQISGSGDVRSLVPGYLFDLQNHYRADYNASYLVTSIDHLGASNLLPDRGEATYSNSFNCIPKSVPYRPARMTPKPVMRGTQTAVVVGPSGQEIYTDKYGRVKVQFYWDREGKQDENSSCWMRVATPWAGKQWGLVHIPRIGQEVVVDFLEGDPDQPLVIGSVYNAEFMPPYDLPDNQTQSGLKTRSSTGGGSSNFNELRFEDKMGSEDIYFHAEKDFHRVVENNDDLQVTNDQTIAIQQGNREVTIAQGNDTLTIKMGNHSTEVQLGSSSTEAMQTLTLKVGQNSITINQVGITISGLTISIQGQVSTDIDGMMTSINGDGMLTLAGGITTIG